MGAELVRSKQSESSSGSYYPLYCGVSTFRQGGGHISQRVRSDPTNHPAHSAQFASHKKSSLSKPVFSYDPHTLANEDWQVLWTPGCICLMHPECQPININTDLGEMGPLANHGLYPKEPKS